MTDLSMLTKEEQIEAMWKEHAEDALIATYVPEAEFYTHEQALKLALERDEAAAREAAASAIDLENAAKVASNPNDDPVIKKIIQELCG